MSTPEHAQLQQIDYFKTQPEIVCILNLRLSGDSYDKVAEGYAKEYPDGGRPDGSTVRRFFKNHTDIIAAEIKKLKPGIVLAEARARLVLLQTLTYETVTEYRRLLKGADAESLGYLSKALKALRENLNEIAVQCGDTLIQTPQGSGGDRPQVFQTVLVEKLVNQTLIVSDGEAEKQSGAKKAGGELLSSQPAVSDSSGPASPA